MKELPNTIRSLVSTFKNTYYLKYNFRRIVRKNKGKSGDYSPETLIKDNSTRWLSTYNMLDRFIYFKDEITYVLNKASKENSTKQNSIGVSGLGITNEEWKYLVELRNILEIFRKPTIKLQARNYSAIHYTIPSISTILTKLEGL